MHAARPVRAAISLRQELGSFGIALRQGIHAGEISVRGDDVSGVAVHIAARVMSLARSRETLTSRVVPMLIEGENLAFGERTTTELSGLPGQRMIYACHHESEHWPVASRFTRSSLVVRLIMFARRSTPFRRAVDALSTHGCSDQFLVGRMALREFGSDSTPSVGPLWLFPDLHGHIGEQRSSDRASRSSRVVACEELRRSFHCGGLGLELRNRLVTNTQFDCFGCGQVQEGCIRQGWSAASNLCSVLTATNDQGQCTTQHEQ